MSRYNTAGVYMLTHFVAGMAATKVHAIVPVFLVYQMWQLRSNTRVFLDKKRIETGNDVVHTGNKILQFVAGMAVGMFLFD